jgi:hypothetical protein
MEGADLLLQIGYLYIYHYIIIYLRQSCPIPNALGCFSLVPFVGGYVSIAPWCHEAASAKAPKAWWQRWKGGEGTNRSGTSPWKMEVFMGRSSINGWFSIAMFQYGTVSLFPSKDTMDFSHGGKPLDSRSLPWKKTTYDLGCTGWLLCPRFVTNHGINHNHLEGGLHHSHEDVAMITSA